MRCDSQAVITLASDINHILAIRILVTNYTGCNTSGIVALHPNLTSTITEDLRAELRLAVTGFA